MGNAHPQDDISRLHPWPVIIAFLSNLSSDKVVRVINLTGIKVDWALTGPDSYSHGTRIRAYIPRIQAAFEALTEEEKLAVARIAAVEIAKWPHLTERITESLARIGWKLEGDSLTMDSIDLRETFFQKGSQHDAYVSIKNILQQAAQSITIVDELFAALKRRPADPFRHSTVSGRSGSQPNQPARSAV